jgi:hypothetical protein
MGVDRLVSMAQPIPEYDWKEISNHIRGMSLSDYWKEDMTTYERQTIKSFMDIQYGSGATIDQLTMSYGYFGAVIKFIEEAGYDVPAELITSRDSSKRDLDHKLKESRKSEIAKIKAELDGLQSAEEKRAKLTAKLAELEEKVK